MRKAARSRKSAQFLAFFRTQFQSRFGTPQQHIQEYVVHELIASYLWDIILGEQATQLFAMTDAIAERARKLRGSALHSIGDIARHKRVKDNDNERAPPRLMFEELLADNKALAANLRAAQVICDQFGDIATASIIETPGR